MIRLKIKILIIILLLSFIQGQEMKADDIMERVQSIKKPTTSIINVRIDIIRKKGDKEKTKIREFTRYEKHYESGRYTSKILARFNKPKVIKGTGLLSWENKDGQTDQWMFLPKLKTAKKIKAKQRSKSFLNTDFIYEDLESRKPGLDSLVNIGIELIDGQQCRVLMAWPKDDSYYFSRKIWVNTQNWQINKVEYYKSQSEKEKTLIISSFIEQSGFITPGKMVMDMGNGNKTVMTITSFQPEVGLNEEIFSKSFLIKI